MMKALDIAFTASGEHRADTTVRALPITHLRAVVDQAIATARDGYAASRRNDLRERLRIIRNFRENVASRASELARELSAEAQRSPAEFLASELIPLLDACRFLEKNTARILRARKHRVMPLWLFGSRHEVIREPLGVVLVIGASNYPLFLPAVQVLQGFVAGNAVLLKPAPAATDCARTLKCLLVEAGISDALVQILPAAPEAATHAISRNVDKIFLTGSAETGRKVLIHAATAIIPTAVELSGCDGVFVLPDADIELAAECIAFGLALNSGHTCIAPRRAFVWQEISEEFKVRLQQALAKRPKTFSRAHTHSEVLANLFEATTKGAHIVHGTACKNGIIEGPLVVANVSADSPFASAENWGPTLSIITVTNENEALQAYHKSRFALGASIFTRSTADGRRLAELLQAGSVCINDLIVPTADGRLPFGGRKQSGFGTTRGAEGLLEMTAVKVISTRAPKSHFHLRRPGKNQLDILAGYASAAYGRGLNRLRGIKEMFAAARKGKTPGRSTKEIDNP